MIYGTNKINWGLDMISNDTKGDRVMRIKYNVINNWV